MKILSFLLLGAVLLIAALAVYSELGFFRAEQLYPPLGKFVTVGREQKIQLHYVDAGQGTPIVLLHGASSSLREFTADLWPCLATHHRTLAFDRPGYGYSDRPTGPWPDPEIQAQMIHEALIRLGVQRPVLVGHSWSASLVLAYLLDHPDEAAGAVLLGGVTHPWEGGVYFVHRLAAYPVLGKLFAHTWLFPGGQFMLKKIATHVYAPNPVPSDHLQKTAALLALRPATFLANAADIRPLSAFLATLAPHYGELSRPVLAISGEEDEVVIWKNQSGQLLRASGKVELVLLKGVGHAPHHVHTDRICDLIDGFSQRESVTHQSPAGPPGVLPAPTPDPVGP
jgi:pimeloyl-ACP methyl ester carboxylesterase